MTFCSVAQTGSACSWQLQLASSAHHQMALSSSWELHSISVMMAALPTFTTHIVNRFRKLVNEKWQPKTPMNHAADRLHAGMSLAELNNQLTCLYAELGCSMGYMCSSTSPQMCFGFKEVSRFMANPGEKHFEALMQLFHYAIEHGHTGLIYKAWVGKYKLTVMHDADFNGDRSSSTSGSQRVEF